MNNLIKNSALSIAIFIGALAQANAASISFSMEYSSNPAMLADGTEYLSVTISDGQSGDIDFRVETLQAIQDSGGALAPGITSFSFNLGNSGATIDNVVSLDDWQILDSPAPDLGTEVFGDFDVKLLMTAGGSVDPLLFSIAGVEGDSINDYASSLSVGGATRFNTVFSANIENLKLCQLQVARLSVGNFDGGSGGLCIDKATFGGPATVVPLPPAMALMFSAMTVLGGIGMYRRKQS